MSNQSCFLWSFAWFPFQFKQNEMTMCPLTPPSLLHEKSCGYQDNVCPINEHLVWILRTSLYMAYSHFTRALSHHLFSPGEVTSAKVKPMTLRHIGMKNYFPHQKVRFSCVLECVPAPDIRCFHIKMWEQMSGCWEGEAAWAQQCWI